MSARRSWIFGIAMVATAACLSTRSATTPTVAMTASTAMSHLSVAPSTSAPKELGSVEVPAITSPTPSTPSSAKCDPPDDLDVLFIGNSYMRMHDVPELVERLAEQSGVELHTEMLAVGGTDFDAHVQRSKTAEVLQSNDWDIVVLQSHSLDPIRDPGGFHASGRELAKMVREVGAEPVLFETWPREVGNDLYRFGRAGYDPEEMHELVHDGYHRLGQRIDAEVIEVGAAWLSLLERDPDLDLYASDSNHPARLGSYLSAAVVFAALTDISPRAAARPLLEVDPRDAEVVLEHVDSVLAPACPV